MVGVIAVTRGEQLKQLHQNGFCLFDPNCHWQLQRPRAKTGAVCVYMHMGVRVRLI